MAQKVKLRLGGTEFCFDADSPQQESQMRIAAEKINRLFTQYDAKYPNVPLINKLLFILLGETVNSIKAAESISAAKSEIEELKQLTDSYLEAHK